MNAPTVKIYNKKYRIISESDYAALLQDIKDLKKIMKRLNEPGINVHEFYKNVEQQTKQ